jgi:hypothetical protein
LASTVKPVGFVKMQITVFQWVARTLTATIVCDSTLESTATRRGCPGFGVVPGKSDGVGGINPFPPHLVQ